MTVAFATLFLGLVLGVQPVELVVGADVARVELLLDGELVGQRTGPPWEIPCDLGGEFAPHELVAVARDADGEELGRVRQWINLPAPEARAPVAVDRAGDGRADVGPELTAVAIEVGGRRRSLGLETLAGRLTVAGRPAVPVSVEKGPAEVVLVMDREAQEGALRMADLWQAPTTRVSTSLEPIDRSNPPVPSIPGAALVKGESSAGTLGMRSAHLRTAMRLEEDQLLRFLWPYALERGEVGVRAALFHRTRGLPPSYGGMLWLLATVYQPPFTPSDQRLADAVAAAGMVAAASGRRRAVVLVLSERPSDASELSPPAVRRYLEHLGVPLHVWAMGPVPDEVAEAWGGVRAVPKKSALRRAVEELSESLERQRIVWVEGRHLPQEVGLSDAGGDLNLVR